MKNIFIFTILFITLFSCGTDQLEEQSSSDSIVFISSDTITVSNEKKDSILLTTELITLSPNTTEKELLSFSNVKKGIYSNGEGDFEALICYNDKKEKVAYLFFNYLTKEISTAEIIDPNFTTEKGLKKGSTYNELMAVYPDLKFQGSEIEGRVSGSSKSTKYGFLMIYREWSEELKKIDELKKSSVDNVLILY